MNHDSPVNLYLVISPADIDRMKPPLRLMTDIIIRRICAKMEFADGSSKAGYKHRLLILLGEFTSLGKLAIMEKALAFFKLQYCLFIFYISRYYRKFFPVFCLSISTEMRTGCG